MDQNKERLKKWIVILGGLLVGMVAIVSVFKATSRPQFCATCHEIAPYVESWQTSVHHPETDCIKCHAEPGLVGYVGRKVYSVKEIVNHFRGITPGQVPVNVPNRNCLQGGCHTEANLIENSRFKHRPHLEDNNVNCIHCHRGVGHTTEVANIGLIGTDEVCLKCHRR